MSRLLWLVFAVKLQLFKRTGHVLWNQQPGRKYGIEGDFLSCWRFIAKVLTDALCEDGLRGRCAVRRKKGVNGGGEQ